MKRLHVPLVWLLAVLPVVGIADSNTATFYLQLVRGTDDAVPPVQGARRVGPKLATTFHPIFRWKHYWEIHRQVVTLVPGRKTRVRLNPQREVEIELTKSGLRNVIAYSDGIPLCRDTRPNTNAMTILGGERDPRTSWFIVVRRDKPQD